LGPIEVLWGVIALFWGFVGVVRGAPRELGVTTVISGMLFFLLRVQGHVEPIMTDVILNRLGAQVREETKNLILVSFFLGSFFLVLLASYAGETLVFPGRPPSGPVGLFVNFFVGLVNGLLVVTTAWYFLDKYGYPLPDWMLNPEEFTPFAMAIKDHLPQRWVPDEAFAAFALGLVILRVRR